MFLPFLFVLSPISLHHFDLAMTGNLSAIERRQVCSFATVFLHIFLVLLPNFKTAVPLFRRLSTGVSRTSVFHYPEHVLRCTNNSSFRGMRLCKRLPCWISILEALTQVPKSSWFSVNLWFLNYVHVLYLLIMKIVYCLWLIEGLLVFFEMNYEAAYVTKYGFIISVTDTSTCCRSGRYLKVQSSKAVFRCGKLLCAPWDRMCALKSVAWCRIVLWLALGLCIGVLTLLVLWSQLSNIGVSTCSTWGVSMEYQLQSIISKYFIR